jgi:hypothetical protein
MGHPLRIPSRWWCPIFFYMLLVASTGCASGTATPGTVSGQAPASTATATATITPTSTPSTATPTPRPTLSPTPSETPTETETPTPNPQAGGPYLVEQTETLGGEKISGVVCSLVKPFAVTSVTPKVTFSFVFVPVAAEHGNVTYSYSIPTAGESHDAKGKYTIRSILGTNKLNLSLQVSDHVVFRGFDGIFPLNYEFDLVPNQNIPCP